MRTLIYLSVGVSSLALLLLMHWLDDHSGIGQIIQSTRPSSTMNSFLAVMGIAGGAITAYYDWRARKKR